MKAFGDIVRNRVLSGIIVALAVGVVTVLTPPASQAAPPSPSPSATASAATNGAYDCDELQPTKIETGSRGEKIYHYEVDGQDTTQTIPPPGFNMANASPDELRAYHLPPAPTDPTARREWAQQVGGTRFAQAGMCATRADLVPANYGTAQPQWGGVSATPWSGHPYTGLYASNRVFTSYSSLNGQCYGNRGETSWVGIQTGTTPYALLQNGTYRSTQVNSDQPRIFYENISRSVTNPPQFPTGLSVSQGDLVFYQMGYTPANATVSGKPEAFYYWNNATTGLSKGLNSQLDGTQSWYDSTSNEAAFIDEKLGSYGLEKYGSIGWSGAYVQGTVGGDAPGNLPHGGYYVQNSFLDSNLDLGLATSASWNNYWHGCS